MEGPHDICGGGFFLLVSVHIKSQSLATLKVVDSILTQCHTLFIPQLCLCIVQRKDTRKWSEWSNPILVDNRHSRIPSLDMFKIGSVFERRVVPVQVS